MSQEDLGSVKENGGERGSVDFGGADGETDGGADGEEGSVDAETAENDEDGDNDTGVDLPQSIAAATDEKGNRYFKDVL